jgi:hypothetical protein
MKKLGIKICAQLPVNKKLTPGIDFLYLKVVERHCAQLFDKKIYLYSPQSSIKSWAQKS